MSLTVPQNMAALERANDIRIARALFKQRLASFTMRESRKLAADALLCPPLEVETMTVANLLAACSRTGPALTGKLLRKARVRDNRRVCDLTARERDRLVMVLRSGS